MVPVIPSLSFLSSFFEFSAFTHVQKTVIFPFIASSASLIKQTVSTIAYVAPPGQYGFHNFCTVLREQTSGFKFGQIHRFLFSSFLKPSLLKSNKALQRFTGFLLLYHGGSFHPCTASRLPLWKGSIFQGFAVELCRGHIAYDRSLPIPNLNISPYLPALKRSFSLFFLQDA